MPASCRARPRTCSSASRPADDAAVYKLDDERALIFTTDFFPPMVDDPALFGAVAAANALNDVFAMGGKPLLALSIAAFPEELPVETVRAIFDAAADKVQEAGAVLAGGHTIRDAEPKYGLAVVGTVHPEALWRKGGARPGDALFLTKPLGTGLVLAGVAKGVLGEAEEAEATSISWPSSTTARPRRSAGFEPGAVTDVTGFGLFGHAHEVAERSGARIVLDAASLPALPGALEAAAQGVRTGGDARNRDFAADALALDGSPGGARRARLRPADGRRPARLPPRRQGSRARGAVPGGGALPRPHRPGRGRERGDRLLMEAGARTARLRSLDALARRVHAGSPTRHSRRSS